MWMNGARSAYWTDRARVFGLFSLLCHTHGKPAGGPVNAAGGCLGPYAFVSSAAPGVCLRLVFAVPEAMFQAFDPLLQTGGIVAQGLNLFPERIGRALADQQMLFVDQIFGHVGAK